MKRLSTIDLTVAARITALSVFAMVAIAPVTAWIQTAHALDILIGSSQRHTFNYTASRVLCRLVNGHRYFVVVVVKRARLFHAVKKWKKKAAAHKTHTLAGARI